MKKKYLIISGICLLVLGLGIFGLTRAQDDSKPADSTAESTSVKEDGTTGTPKEGEDQKEGTEGSSVNSGGEDTQPGGNSNQTNTDYGSGTNPDTELPEIEIPLNEEDWEDEGEYEAPPQEEDPVFEGNDEVTVEEDGTIVLPEIP